MSPFNEDSQIWMNGKFVPWREANIHIASHVIHYGSSIFEGFRTYDTSAGSIIFRLHDHTRRLFDSCKIYRMDIPFSQEEINQAIRKCIEANRFKECYVRPLVYRGYTSLGVNPFPNPVDCAVLVWEWGKYLGDEALEKGVDVRVSSWRRMAPDTFPALAKAGANYMNSQLIKMESAKEGYIEGIALNHAGFVSEGSGENIFVIRDGRIYTPPLSASVLPGITRDSVMTLAREKKIPVIEAEIPREMLYIADEVFFTGSAAEITPVRSIDKIEIGTGKRGPVTEELQTAFFDYINGERTDTYNWLTHLYNEK